MGGGVIGAGTLVGNFAEDGDVGELADLPQAEPSATNAPMRHIADRTRERTVTFQKSYLIASGAMAVVVSYFALIAEKKAAASA